MALDLFNKQQLADLENKVTQQSDIISKAASSIDILEEYIKREKSGSKTFSSLTSDINKIGDPYFYNTIVRRSIDLIANSIAALDLQLLSPAGKEIPTTSKEYKLFDYINDEDSVTDFIFEIVRNLYRFGKAFVLYLPKDSEGIPTSFDVPPANEFKAVVKNGMLQYWEYGTKKQKIDKDRVLFIRYKHPSDPYDGLAPGSSAIMEILEDFYAHTYNIQNLKEGAQGKGVWKAPNGEPPLTATQQQEAQIAADNTFNKGVTGAGKGNVFRRNLEWVRTSQDNRDLEYNLLLDKMQSKICIAYGIPEVIFKSSDSTFTNLGEAKKIFWNQTLLPIVDMLEEAFNTNFFKKLNMTTTLYFDVESVPELQDDLDVRLGRAERLKLMGVPLSILNEYLSLGLPEWDGMDDTPEVFAFETQIEEIKETTVKETIKQMKIEEEKRINTDDFYKQIEYQKTKDIIVSHERRIEQTTKSFYVERYKEFEKWMESNPPIESKSVNKQVSDEYVEELIKHLDSLDWSFSFMEEIIPEIDTVFQDGCRRSYSGIGANWQLKPERAIQHLTQRALKLKDSPANMKSQIINALEGESFSIDELAKTISKTWKEASIGKAKTIARSETTSAYNHGREKGMEELGIKYKEWIHSGDGHVRDSHRISQVVPVGEKFTLNDGERVSYPGDGSADNSVNCRCTIVSVL